MNAIDNDKFIVFGGLSNRMTHFCDVFVLDLKNRVWKKPLTMTGSIPPPRGFHVAVTNKTKMWIYGGGSEFDQTIGANTMLFNDIHSLNIEELASL
jgi:hypothetical protein